MLTILCALYCPLEAGFPNPIAISLYTPMIPFSISSLILLLLYQSIYLCYQQPPWLFSNIPSWQNSHFKNPTIYFLSPLAPKSYYRLACSPTEFQGLTVMLFLLLQHQTKPICLPGVVAFGDGGENVSVDSDLIEVIHLVCHLRLFT